MYENLFIKKCIVENCCTKYDTFSSALLQCDFEIAEIIKFSKRANKNKHLVNQCETTTG